MKRGEGIKEYLKTNNVLLTKNKTKVKNKKIDDKARYYG